MDGRTVMALAVSHHAIYNNARASLRADASASLFLAIWLFQQQQQQQKPTTSRNGTQIPLDGVAAATIEEPGPSSSVGESSVTTEAQSNTKMAARTRSSSSSSSTSSKKRKVAGGGGGGDGGEINDDARSRSRRRRRRRRSPRLVQKDVDRKIWKLVSQLRKNDTSTNLLAKSLKEVEESSKMATKKVEDSLIKDSRERLRVSRQSLTQELELLGFHNRQNASSRNYNVQDEQFDRNDEKQFAKRQENAQRSIYK